VKETMKIVFLHGIGDGDPGFGWLDGLNRGLTQAGFDAVDRDHVIAPRYSSILTTDGISAELPDVTYKPRNEAVARREFERRQARVERQLRLKFGVRSFGFNQLIPELIWGAVPQYVVGNVPLFDLPQVRRYVSREGVRGAVMRHILDHLPTYGDVMIIGHSLGSVIAIDLLDHLHPDLHVARFITIGSPANIRALHEGSERLLKKFPYSRVDDWSNFLNNHDIVTGGRGLASIFPGAQDFMLGITGHAAGGYLSDAAVAGLVADTIYPRREVTPAVSGTHVRMTDAQASALLIQHFSEAVAGHIKDDDRGERYRSAVKLLRDDLAAQLAQQARAGHLLAPELGELMAGELPALPQRWEIDEAVGSLVALTLANCVEPYDIKVEKESIAALEDISSALGFTRQTGKTIGIAVNDVRGCIAGKDHIAWSRVLTAAAGLALVAAAPVGLAAAAPAGVFGAAAITSALAGFGPGGMIGGLATLGGLAGTGAAITTAAAVASPHHDPAPNLAKLTLRVAVEHARHLLDMPHEGTVLWYDLADFESRISAMINRLEPLNDPDSLKLIQLRAAKVAVQALIRFMDEKDLSPRALTASEEESVEA